MKIHVSYGKKMKDEEGGCLGQIKPALQQWAQAPSLL